MRRGLFLVIATALLATGCTAQDDTSASTDEPPAGASAPPTAPSGGTTPGGTSAPDRTTDAAAPATELPSEPTAPPTSDSADDRLTDDGLAPLVDECSAGDVVSCDELRVRSEPGTTEDQVARTCGGRTIDSDSCAAVFCPERAFGERTGIPSASRIVAEFETESFDILICESGVGPLYFAQAKAPPNASIVLDAAPTPDGGFVARNPGVTASDEYVYSVGGDGLVVRRGDEVLVSQPLLEGRTITDG